MPNPIWAYRNKFLLKYNLENSSIIDFGCGDKSILSYIKFKDYFGLDKVPPADMIVDFNKCDFQVKKRYDVGLILGVLEYLDNPTEFLRYVKIFADSFIILILPKEIPKKEWAQSFTEKTFTDLLQNVFVNIDIISVEKYLIAKCN